MAEYHVGCGLFGNIYAGTYAPPRKDGLQAWRNKSEVTSEAVEAVMGHFITEMSVTIRQSSKRCGELSETRS